MQGEAPFLNERLGFRCSVGSTRESGGKGPIRHYRNRTPVVWRIPSTQTVLGIDLGVTSLAFASTGMFWQGDEYNHWCREFEKQRGEMHQRGMQAAHNALLRLAKREEAWRTQYIHTVATEIIAEAVEHDCDVIVFEDLTDIHEQLPQATWHHLWAFRRLYAYVEYKAAERGAR